VFEPVLIDLVFSWEWMLLAAVNTFDL